VIRNRRDPHYSSEMGLLLARLDEAFLPLLVDSVTQVRMHPKTREAYHRHLLAEYPGDPERPPIYCGVPVVGDETIPEGKLAVDAS